MPSPQDFVSYYAALETQACEQEQHRQCAAREGSQSKNGTQLGEFPRMSATRMRVPNPVGSAQPATSVAGPSFARRSGHDDGTVAATPRRTAALRPPEPPGRPSRRLKRRRLSRGHPPPPPLPPPPSPSSPPPPPWSEVSQRSNWVAGSKGKCRVRHAAGAAGWP
jgi:hypothetical protein